MKKSKAAIKLMKYVMGSWGRYIPVKGAAPVKIVAEQLKALEANGIKFDKE